MYWLFRFSEHVPAVYIYYRVKKTRRLNVLVVYYILNAYKYNNGIYIDACTASSATGTQYQIFLFFFIVALTRFFFPHSRSGPLVSDRGLYNNTIYIVCVAQFTLRIYICLFRHIHTTVHSLLLLLFFLYL